MTETQLPKKGFYVHYKHDANGLEHNYMYEVVGVGKNTEDSTLTVLYRPLYRNEWMAPADLMSRPLGMFFESVEWKGVMTPRFSEITDQALLAELTKARDEIYHQ